MANLSKYTQKVVKAGTSRRALGKAQPADALRGIELGYRLHDAFPAERKIVDQRSVELNLSIKSDDELAEMLGKLTKEAEELKGYLTTAKEAKPIEAK
jgi:hypothetical protein